MTHINQRRDTASRWASFDPVLMLGEVGWETDTRQAKLGDGVTPWSALPYAVKEISGIADVPGLQAELNAINSTLSSHQNEIDDRAPLNSPAFTGNPTAPTQPIVSADLSLANTQFVHNVMPITYDGMARGAIDMDGYEIGGLSLPTTGFSATNKNYVDTKAPIASPTFTGDPKAPTPAYNDNDTSVATTAFVRSTYAHGAMRQTANYTLPTGYSRVPMNVSDTAENVTTSTASARITVSRAGLYLITARCAAQSASVTGDLTLSVRISGSTTNLAGTAIAKFSGGWLLPNLVTLFYLSANQYIELWARNESGASITNTVTAGDGTWQAHLGCVHVGF